MNVTFDKSFSKKLDKLKNQQLKEQIIFIVESCEKAKKITDIPNIKKIKRLLNKRVRKGKDGDIFYFYWA